MQQIAAQLQIRNEKLLAALMRTRANRNEYEKKYQNVVQKYYEEQNRVDDLRVKNYLLRESYAAQDKVIKMQQELLTEMADILKRANGEIKDWNESFPKIKDPNTGRILLNIAVVLEKYDKLMGQASNNHAI